MAHASMRTNNDPSRSTALRRRWEDTDATSKKAYTANTDPNRKYVVGSASASVRGRTPTLCWEMILMCLSRP